MKANEFVKKFGWEVAATDLRNHEKYGTRSILYIYEDLKRLVESWELVDSYGGLDELKEFLSTLSMEPNDYLKQAIADVESCQ